MSWDSYIDDLIAKSDNACDKVCIISLEDGSKWTTDDHANALQLQDSEAAQISKCFKSKDFTEMAQGGVFAFEQRYQFLRAEDDRLVMAKMKSEGGLTLQCSKTAIVIAHTAEGQPMGNTNKAVNATAEYLESQGM